MKKVLLFIMVLATCSVTTLQAQINSADDGVNVVVIDAGHGGIDPGNLGTKRYKTTEKDIALAVALKVGAYIEENCKGVKVIYTRKTDVLVDLKERAEIANRAHADLFISIHCNSFKKSSVVGSSTYVLGKNHDDDNLRVAMRENSVIFLESDYKEKYEGFDPNRPESYIAFSLYQGAFINQSISFAQKVQNQFRERVNRVDRGVKQEPLMVTKMAIMPAVLIELGFLTNPDEEDFLRSEQGQSYMASAIYRAFKAYKEERESIDLKPIGSNISQDSDAVTASKSTSSISQKTTTTPSTKPQDVITGKQDDAHEVYYTVQIATSGIKKDLNPSNFKGVEGVHIYQDGGLYKYIVGRASDMASANAIKVKMQEAGFKDAFVVAFANGKRISLQEAGELLK